MSMPWHSHQKSETRFQIYITAAIIKEWQYETTTNMRDTDSIWISKQVVPYLCCEMKTVDLRSMQDNGGIENCGWQVEVSTAQSGVQTCISVGNMRCQGESVNPLLTSWSGNGNCTISQGTLLCVQDVYAHYARENYFIMVCNWS